MEKPDERRCCACSPWEVTGGSSAAVWVCRRGSWELLSHHRPPKTPLQPMQVQHQRVGVSAPGQQLLFRPKNHVRLRQEAEMPSGLSMMSMEVKPISHWSELALTPRNPSPEDHERIEEQSPQQQLWVFYFAFPLTTLALVNGRDLFTTWRHFQRLWLRSKAEIRH